MKTKIWVLIALAMVFMIPGVMALATTPTCTFVDYTPAEGAITTNTTLYATVQSNVNMSNATISIYPHNGTYAGVFTADGDTGKEEKNMTAIWTLLGEGVYKVDATAYFDNNTDTTGFTNLSKMSATCTSRYYTVNTNTGTLIPKKTTEAKEDVSSSRAGIALAVVLVIGLYLWWNKK